MMRVIGVAALAAALLASVPAKAQDTIRAGIQIGALGALRTALPEVSAKHRLKYDIKDFTDSTAALRALEQGELDVANTTVQHLVRAANEGIDVVWVAGWGGGYNVLVSRQQFNVPANNPSALKAAIDGRKASGVVKIAVPTGSLQHAKLLSFLKSSGIDPDKDVQIVNLPFPNHPRAIEAGEVDLALSLAGFGALAVEKSNARLVQHLFGEGFGKQEIGFIVHRKLIQQKPELVQRIVDSHAEAMKLFLGDMNKQVAYEAKYSRFPEPVVQKTEREFLRYDYRTNLADLKTMAREMHSLGWARQDFSAQIDSMIDLRFIAKATGMSVEALTRW